MISIHEDVLFPAVSVEIADKFDGVVSVEVPDHPLGVVDHWMQDLVGSLPSSV